MARLEIHTFTIAPGIDEAEFRARDARMQEWCHLHRPGIRRRTTAIDGRNVVVVSLFDDAPDVPDESPATVREWRALVTDESFSVYSLL